MASENMNSAIATLEFPRCYQRHVIKALSVRYFYAALVEILVICVVGTYFLGARVMAGGYGGASSVFFFSVLFWLDISSSWYYEVTEDGIRFRSRMPLYGPYPKSICHVDWKKQTLVDVQQGKWHNYPTIQLKLAPTDRLR